MRLHEAVARLIEQPGEPLLVAEVLERVAHHLNNPLGTATIEAWNLARALDRIDHAVRSGEREAALAHLSQTRTVLGNLVEAQSDLKKGVQVVQQAAEQLEGSEP